MDEEKFMNEFMSGMTDVELLIFTDTLEQIAEAEIEIEEAISKKERGEL